MKFLSNSIILLLLLSTVSLTAANAETREERLAVAKEYVEATLQNLNLDEMIQQMWMPIIQQSEAAGKEVSDDQKSKIHAIYIAEFSEPMRDLMKQQDEVMADLFTLEEITALRDFYSTKAGSSVMQKMPQVIAKQQPLILQMVQQRIPAVIPKLQSILAQ